MKAMRENEKRKYVGITIGPIYNTILETSSPAGMWAASYLFSLLAWKLCDLLKEDMRVASPNYEAALPMLQNGEGIGLMPDHLIFENKNLLSMTQIALRFTQAKEWIADLFGPDGEAQETIDKRRLYFNLYLQIHAVEFETRGNPIADSAQLLSAVELEQTFPTLDNEQYILDFFDYRRNQKDVNDESKNRNIKNSKMVSYTVDEARWQLLDQANLKRPIRELKDIADSQGANTRKMKKHSYYAIIHADGDRIGKLVCGLKPEEIPLCSEKLLCYAHEVCGQIDQYGGMTIYAGGDDLLAIVPVESKLGKNIFGLLSDIRDLFRERFGKGVDDPTLSVGCAICFYKYPLYEAFDLAYQMMRKAKTGTKNALAIHLQKHSGQSVGLRFPNWTNNPCACKLNRLIDSLASHNAEDQLLSSAAIKLRQFEKLFAYGSVLGGTSVQNLFGNIFDDGVHQEKQSHAYLQSVQELLLLANPEFCELIATKESDARWLANVPDEKDSLMWSAHQRLRVLDGLLRFIQFFLEKGDERADAQVIG